jgi:hypothetical protein
VRCPTCPREAGGPMLVPRSAVAPPVTDHAEWASCPQARVAAWVQPVLGPAGLDVACGAVLHRKPGAIPSASPARYRHTATSQPGPKTRRMGGQLVRDATTRSLRRIASPRATAVIPNNGRYASQDLSVSLGHHGGNGLPRKGVHDAHPRRHSIAKRAPANTGAGPYLRHLPL